MENLVSVIMPAYNAELYILEAIRSVINQPYENWELLVVDNNSSDNTAAIIKSISDLRVKYLFEARKGVGYARNLALARMKGEYFCFLDADDLFVDSSIKERVKMFKDSTINFVDGRVDYINQKGDSLDKCYIPNFKGEPLSRLLKLDRKCFFGNTWMIRRDVQIEYSFDTKMTHSEDIFFYMSISRDQKYTYVTDTVLLYRQVPSSAMVNLNGLEKGYILLIQNSRKTLNQNWITLFVMKILITKIMFLSYLLDGRDFISAIKSPFKIMNS